jgi:hypothetical protein
MKLVDNSDKNHQFRTCLRIKKYNKLELILHPIVVFKYFPTVHRGEQGAYPNHLRNLMDLVYSILNNTRIEGGRPLKGMATLNRRPAVIQPGVEVRR